jgi:hypothetical protein
MLKNNYGIEKKCTQVKKNELFSLTVIAKKTCGKRSWMKFAKDLLQGPLRGYK